MASKALAFGAATVGGIMIYSGLAGVSVMDVLAGQASLKGADPKGGKGLGPLDLFNRAKGTASTLVPPGALLSGTPSKKSAIDAVEWAAAVAAGHGVGVISAFRGAGERTSSGNLSNHAGNDKNRAARDLSNTGNAKGSPEQEAAVRDILRGFGRRYPKRGEIIDSFKWGDLDVEVIYRTPKYGGHIGHIHVGAHR